MLWKDLQINREDLDIIPDGRREEQDGNEEKGMRV